MTHLAPALQKRRTFFALSAAGILSGWGCAQSSNESAGAPKIAAKPFKMGERAAVGLLTYNVLEATYFAQLGNAQKPRIANKRFLVIRMSITNGGAKEAEIPLFHVVDDQGAEIQELQDGDGIQGWSGLIRRIGPTMTEEGRIVFDLQPRNYKLMVSDGAETGKEQFAQIEIPMDFDTAEPIPSNGQK